MKLFVEALLKKKWRMAFLLLLLVGTYHTIKPLPQDISYKGEVRIVSEDNVAFFADRTYMVGEEYVREHTIFDEVFRMIDGAEEYILIDMFLFNDFTAVGGKAYRELSSELTERLLAKKKINPEIIIQVITDPINTVYGGMESEMLSSLENAGISVIITDLTKLRDSNPLYSAPWRVFLQWFGNSSEPGSIPNPFDSSKQKLGLRTFFTLLNYKANHRKVIVVDRTVEGEVDGERVLSSLITSANPHDGSSSHSNSAVRVDGNFAYDVILSEAAVAAFSGYGFLYPEDSLLLSGASEEGDELTVQLLTERKIKEAIIEELAEVGEGDRIDMAMFYISERDIVDALKAADERGAKLRLLFDANKDAFGREKKGIPNRQVAHELMSSTEGNTVVRWCNTHGEQCHSKLLLITKENAQVLIQGSANLTRRNLDNYNLETNLALWGTGEEQVFIDAHNFFSEQWENQNDIEYSLPYEVFADESRIRTLRYRLKEWSGVSRW